MARGQVSLDKFIEREVKEEGVEGVEGVGESKVEVGEGLKGISTMAERSIIEDRQTGLRYAF